MCFFLHIKSLPNLLFGVLCLPGDQGHPFTQLTINPLARCICWAGLLGRAVFPPWNEGPNFGSYTEQTFWYIVGIHCVSGVKLVDLGSGCVIQIFCYLGLEASYLTFFSSVPSSGKWR